MQVLRRLLAEGIRPHWVVSKVWAPFLTQKMGFAEEDTIRDHDLRIVDGPLVERCFTDPGAAYSKLVKGGLVPAFHYRSPASDGLLSPAGSAPASPVRRLERPGPASG